MDIFLSDKAFIGVVLSAIEVYRNECVGVFLATIFGIGYLWSMLFPIRLREGMAEQLGIEKIPS